MNIDHNVFVRANELCDQYRREMPVMTTTRTKGKQPTIALRSYRLELDFLGLKIRGYDKTDLKNFLTYQKIVPWHDLAAPTGKVRLEYVFAEIDAAVDRKLEESKNADPSPSPPRQIYPTPRQISRAQIVPKG